MGIRDEEISRLVKYAEAMGVKVKFSNLSKVDYSAEWTLDGTEITIFMKYNKTKTDTILSLIHEIGHHVWFVHEKNRTPDLKFDEAITREGLANAETPAPKKLREKILSVEIAGTKWWETIYKETDLKIPKWKLFMQMEEDIWAYEKYVETGYLPTVYCAESLEKEKQLLLKYKGKKYE